VTTINGKLSLCFDKIDKLKGKHHDGECFSSEGSHKGKHVDDEGIVVIAPTMSNPFPTIPQYVISYLRSI
jgi:hypothetical protein